MADRILILGASARAAAASARRAGLTPFAVDLFADADTERICEKVWRCPLDRYLEGLFELAKHAPPMPWMYTGGLENYPELVGTLARERELWGNGPDVLTKVRDPRWLADRHGPPIVMPGDTPPDNGEWVRKPLRGAGGLGVRKADADDLRGIADPECGYFLQEYVNGIPSSAVFRGQQLIGVTRQLIGTPWLHAAGCQYVGNVTEESRFFPDVNGFGQLHPLLGVWGVDLLKGDGWAVPIEVNPRFPASAEVIEFATGCPALIPSDKAVNPRRLAVVGKAIYYAPLPVTFPVTGPWDVSLARCTEIWVRPDFADIPHPGTEIEPGQPVLTILTAADSSADCLARLQSRAADLDRLFGYRPTSEDIPCPR